MALPQDRFWELFQNSPLFEKWQDFGASSFVHLERRTVPAGQLIYDPNTLPVHFFLVADGVVRESWQRDSGAVWLRRTYGAGQFFGARALFPGPYVADTAGSPSPQPLGPRQQAVRPDTGPTEQYWSTAQAETDVVLYLMSAADLRVATERNPELFEVLLQETRARRLRRLPFFRDLNDAEVRCLAEVIDAVNVDAGKNIVPDQDPGLWLIDWGQIEVTGPASLNRPEWPKWCLTSGGFFLADGPGLTAGRSCLADTAKAVRMSCLFHLPIEAFERLAKAFPAVVGMLRRPLDIASVLARADVFRDLSEGQRQHLAQFCSWEFVPAGQNITTQGNIGHSFVILHDGAAIVLALDGRGRPRPRNHLTAEAGDYYGHSSLLEGKPRDATVRAVAAAGRDGKPGLNGAECILLDRRDMQVAFKERKDLWPSATWLVSHTKQIREAKLPYPWMEEGETLAWDGRPFIWWLIEPLLLIGLVFILSVLVLVQFLAGSLANLPIVALIALGLVFIPAALWAISNYYNDYYVVTSRRVTRRDRVWLLYEARSEVPIDMVQDASTEQNLWGRLLDFGDLTIRTAAKPGSLVFKHVPAPDTVKDIVLAGKGGAVAATYGQRKETLRRGVITGLNLALPIPERIRALGAASDEEMRRKKKAKTELLPGTKRPPIRRQKFGALLPASWQRVLFGPSRPEPKPLPGQVVWRKSIVNLIMRAGPAFGCTALWLLLGAAISPVTNWLSLQLTALLLPWLLVLACLAFWSWWQWTDWHNDIYVVTDDQIIDLEVKPLGLDTKRRTAGLDRVQTADSVQEGFIRNILNYGDVIIRTAAGDEGFTFVMVPNPKEVQSIIFKKLAEFQRRQEAKRAEERQRDIIEGLDVYHELRRSKLREEV